MTKITRNHAFLFLFPWLSYNADLADADTDSADATDSADLTDSTDLADSAELADSTDSVDSTDSLGYL